MREHLKLLVMTLVVSLIAVSAPGQAPSAGNAVHTPDYSKESFIIEKITQWPALKMMEPAAGP